MPVLGANITKETNKVLNDLLKSEKFVRFALQNKLTLFDNTLLIRLAIINFVKHLPSNEEVLEYKIALLSPSEFENFLKEYGDSMI